LQGRYLLLYFYPKDSTPVCTVQGCMLREHHSQFSALNCAILGISRDTVKSHEKFKAKHEFPFDLLSDTEETLCQAFEVLKNKSMFGVQVRGIERSSFLINPEGVLVKEWRKVKVTTHIADVLETLQQLQQG
jgi:thioredoxin-dependent peroxiredoxin